MAQSPSQATTISVPNQKRMSCFPNPNTERSCEILVQAVATQDDPTGRNPEK